jgi:DNA-binding transcriptional MerR regulator
LKVEALSSEEWNYLRGLFFADGNRFVRRHGKKDYRILFFFQGDEGDLASRSVAMLERAGLRPRLGWDKRENMLVVWVSSRSLLEFLPDKGALRDDVARREKLFEEQELFSVKCGVPFMAGLLDGDGSLQVRVNKRCFRRSPSMHWSFSQSRYPFLIDYVVSFVKSVAPSGVKVRVCERGKREVDFRVHAVHTLLRLGIAKYSWKAARCLDEASRLLVERGMFYTTSEVGAMFGLSVQVVNRWVRDGKLKFCTRVGIGRNARRYFSREDVESFAEELGRVEKVKHEGLSLREVAGDVGVSDTMLRKLWHSGQIQATMVHGERGPKYLVIPRDDVQKLKQRYQRTMKRKEREG